MAKFDFNNSPNAQMIQNVKDKSIKKANAKTVIDIPLTEIDENPDNKNVFNMNEIERLAQNIKEEGFFGTIDVYQKPDGRYEISSGHRRYKAMELLGMKTIPATVTQLPERDTKKRRKLIASNINSRNMSPLDWARAIQYHYETLALEDAAEKNKSIEGDKRYRADGNRLDNLAEYFGFSQFQIARYLRLNKLIPELQDMIENKVIPWTAICDAGTFSESEQKEVYNDLLLILKEATTTPGEDGEPKKSLSGVQVSNIVKNKKENNDEAKTKKMAERSVINLNEKRDGEAHFELPKTEDDLSQKGDLPQKDDLKPSNTVDTMKVMEEESDEVSVAFADDYEDALPFPVLEDTSSSASVDTVLSKAYHDIELFVLNNKYTVDDKEAVTDTINRIENILSDIKNKMK